MHISSLVEVQQSGLSNIVHPFHRHTQPPRPLLLSKTVKRDVSLRIVSLRRALLILRDIPVSLSKILRNFSSVDRISRIMKCTNGNGCIDVHVSQSFLYHMPHVLWHLVCYLVTRLTELAQKNKWEKPLWDYRIVEGSLPGKILHLVSGRMICFFDGLPYTSILTKFLRERNIYWLWARQTESNRCNCEIDEDYIRQNIHFVY